ncbi:MAG: TonB-dependent receptor [Acidobacteria bacterium]|nr:MAG: TonB-dependent receptor [Acidobacteriota bacterium]
MRLFPLVLLFLSLPFSIWAQSITMQGIVHDPEHRPVAHATVLLESPSAARATTTNDNGEFSFDSVAPGGYTLVGTSKGFAAKRLSITVTASGNPVFHLELAVQSQSQQVTVSAKAVQLNRETSTSQTTVTALQIQRAPGADRANSLAMITDFVPGAYVVHNMLHVRGGHQESWFLDGIPVLNTNIASNVGPVVDPGNISSLQVQTGGYSAEYGGRGYGFFDAMTPSGFNLNNQAELTASAGNFGQTHDQLSFGSHTQRAAYYASLDGNFSQLGLYAPSPEVLHDNTAGLGALLSVTYNASDEDQLHVLASLRGDNYQIPNTPAQQASGIADRDLERDTLIGMIWTHTSPRGIVLTSSPFYHFNRANFVGGPSDTPFVLNDNRRSLYYGDLTSLIIPLGAQTLTSGFEVWGEHDDTLFNLRANPGSAVSAQRFTPSADSEAAFLEDSWHATPWLGLNGGVHLTRYSGLVTETAADPRVGASLLLPSWRRGPQVTLHGYYAQYYQQPPLDTISGPLLNFTLQQGFAFVPLQGERDKQWDAGLSVPLHGWFVNFDHFRTDASHFLDHDELESSDIFLPLTDAAARVIGNEVTLRSPEIAHRARLRVAYSNQIARARGPVTGGLIKFAPAGWFLLDHDQRNTLNAVLTTNLPWQSWASVVYTYGSGFLDGDGPAHLPPNSLVGLSMGKQFGESLSASLNFTNLANARYLLDNSNTFGGTHWQYPRQFYVQLRWRLHY